MMMDRQGSIRLVAMLVMVALLSACDHKAPGDAVAGEAKESPQAQAPMAGNSHARHFMLREGPGYQVLEIDAPQVNEAQGRPAAARFLAVLVPRDEELPALPADLSEAVIVRTPVQRVAVTSNADERMLTELGVADRLVAVGGTKSYDDAVRARTLRKELGQVGYSWHSPPNLDVLVASRPDVFLLRVWSLNLATSLQRANALGVPSLPVLIDAESTYLARAEWIKVFGALTGRMFEAQASFQAIEREVDRLKALASSRPTKPVLWAYHAGGQRWVATVRGAEAGFLTDAGGVNLLARPGAPGANETEEFATDTLLAQTTDATCWIAGDIHARALPDRKLLPSFRAWREGCFFANFGRSNFEWDAYDYYETGVVRPDLMLRDFVKMLHPDLVAEPFVFLQPLARDATGSRP